MEKEELIKAINSKGLRNSLISIYYNIGRALPFEHNDFQMAEIPIGIAPNL